MINNLHNKVAIITGGNQGLGLEIAKKFVLAGANIMLFARDYEMLELARKNLENYSSPSQNICILSGDVSSEGDVSNLVNITMNMLGHCDILVNNAGIYGPKGSVETNDWSAWVKTIEINLFGSVLLCRALLPHFKQQSFGKIIQLSGGGATSPLPFLSAYAASKAAVVRFIETLAEEVQGSRIDVNAIAPGALNTRMLDEVLDAGADAVGASFYNSALKQKESGGVPLTIAADLALFLASSASDGITGKLISAPWDNWEEWPEHVDILSNSDVYSLRRIIGRDRGYTWGDK